MVPMTTAASRITFAAQKGDFCKAPLTTSLSSEENRVGVVSVASRLGAERSGVLITAETFSSSPKRADWSCGQFRHLFNDHWGSSPGAKCPGREVNHSLASSVEVKN
jgi:hypothetical protein